MGYRGNLWGPQDDADSIDTIRYAVDQGINWIDTAAIYGNGHSEEVVGLALRDMPQAERPLVFTKGGLSWRDGERVRSGVAASLRLDLEQSLLRLGLETIDLFQMHWLAADVPLEDYWQTLLDLRAEGKVRHVGLSNHDAAQLARCEAIGHVESLQPPFSMIRREAGNGILPWCANNGTGVIIYSPMQSSLLTGAFSRERVEALAPSDFRRENPEFQGKALDRNLALVEALRPIAERRDVAVSALALAWTLAWPAVTGAIVGARSPGQIDGWLASAALALTTEDLAEITAAIDASGAGAGPTSPSASVAVSLGVVSKWALRLRRYWRPG